MNLKKCKRIRRAAIAFAKAHGWGERGLIWNAKRRRVENLAQTARGVYRHLKGQIKAGVRP
jgi:hypothetical protein